MDLKDKYPFRQIDYHKELGVEEHIPLGNMSSCDLEDGNMLLSIRQFNYIMGTRNRKGRHLGSFLENRKYFFVITDSEFNFISEVRCNVPGISMYEDLRLMRYGNVIQASGTDVSPGGTAYVVATLDLELAGNELKLVSRTPFAWTKEKNYMPIEGVKGVFVTDMMRGCIRTASVSDPTHKHTRLCPGSAPFRGSTQLLRWRDEYVCLVHDRINGVYCDAFAFFSEALDRCAITPLFTALHDISPVNFCCGMVIKDGEALLLMCSHDHDMYVFRVPLAEMRSRATTPHGGASGPKYNPRAKATAPGRVMRLRTGLVAGRDTTASDAVRTGLHDKALVVLRRRSNNRRS